MKSSGMLFGAVLVLCIIVLSVCAEAKTMENVEKYNLTIPTVMYHKVIESEKPSDITWCVSKELLENDFKEYLAAGFTPITISEYLIISDAYKEYELSDEKERVSRLNKFLDLISKTPNPILITFDDGYSDNYDILFPLVKKYRIKINIALVGLYSESSENYLSEEEIKEMSESGYVEFGNHSYSLHEMSNDKLESLYSEIKNMEYITDDIENNEKFIKNITGKPSGYFAYPSGVFSEMTENILDFLNMRVSLATNISENFVKLSDNVRTIARYNRSPDLSSFDFVSLLISRIKSQSPEAFDCLCKSLKKYEISSIEKNNKNNLTKIVINYNNQSYNLYGVKKNNITYVSYKELRTLDDQIVDNIKISNFKNWLLYAMEMPKTSDDAIYYPVREFFTNSGFVVEYISETDLVYIYK